MQVFKCKICGGDVSVDRDTGIAVCEYCGTKQVLPQFSDNSSKRLYESGHHYLQNGEYDKAEAVFNQLLAINPQDAEIYWDLVLCKYGVTFVKDPKTEKYIPTCNRTHYESVLNDKNYQNALKYSDAEQMEFYRENAKTINHIQKGILTVSKKEKPFDVFISYKETDSEGNRTKDSITAQKLYEELTESGYKVFFSRITLENKIGTEYEPYIYAALYSSKVMLTVCSSKENIESPWVRNEWSRFLTLRQNNIGKALIPLYFDMSKADLPDEFALLSSYDMKVDGFKQELLRGIKKLIPLPIMKAARRKKAKKTAGITAAVVCVTATIVAAIVLPNYIKAQRLEEQYTTAIAMFENADYEGASAAFSGLGDYKDSAEMVEKCAIQPGYDAAMQLYYDGDYAEATWAFEALGDYGDAAEQKEQVELSWRKSLATVATDDFDEYSTSYYIINENGTVDGTSGSAHSDLSIENHGRIISITPSADKLYALHEDGYVSNAKENNQLSDDSEWHDIVKISRQLENTNIALRSDGKMFYGNTGSDEVWNDEWIKGISEWTDIVDFKLCYPNGRAYSDGTGAIIGIKSDGSLCAVYNDNNTGKQSSNSSITFSTFTTEKLQEIVARFSNVRTLAFNITSYDPNPIEIIALTKDGKLQIYQDGTFTEMDADNICDVSFSASSPILLYQNGDIAELGSKNIALHDIISINNIIGNVITRSGIVYSCTLNYYDLSISEWSESGKSIVYDEWLARLN